MKKTFNKKYMQQNCGCYSQEKLMKTSFMKKDSIKLKDIVDSEIPIKDKYWFVIRKTELTTRQKQDIAIDIATIVLPIYEAKYPESKAPREALEAAKQYLGGYISLEVLNIKRNAAAYAANAANAAANANAADAAYAAYAATYAADAAATYAANAAYANAADANAAARNKDISYNEKLKKYLDNLIETYS